MLSPHAQKAESKCFRFEIHLKLGVKLVELETVRMRPFPAGDERQFLNVKLLGICTQPFFKIGTVLVEFALRDDKLETHVGGVCHAGLGLENVTCRGARRQFRG